MCVCMYVICDPMSVWYMKYECMSVCDMLVNGCESIQLWECMYVSMIFRDVHVYVSFISLDLSPVAGARRDANVTLMP